MCKTMGREEAALCVVPCMRQEGYHKGELAGERLRSLRSALPALPSAVSRVGGGRVWVSDAKRRGVICPGQRMSSPTRSLTRLHKLTILAEDLTIHAHLTA